MKTLTLLLTTTLLIGCVTAATAQTKQPIFKTPLSQQDIQQQFNTLQVIGQRLHSIHLDAMLRDSLDNIIGKSAQILSARYREAFIADSLVNVKGKKQ